MATRSLRLLLPVCIGLAVACGGTVEPEGQVLDRVELTPPSGNLSLRGPRDTLRLVSATYDRAGALIRGTGTTITYSSSATGTATVSNAGLVRAIAPGTAEITATATLGNVTRTHFMTVTVYDADVFEAPGVYDLTALIQSFDPKPPAGFEGYRYAAELTVHEEWGSPWLGATYANLRRIGPGGDTVVVTDAGAARVFIDTRGRLVLELLPVGLNLTVARLVQGRIEGVFSCCGPVGGAFTATRRVQ